MKKEEVGHVPECSARILQGIGSYQDMEAACEADKVLRDRLSEAIDQLVGRTEWLKIDLAKKGAIKHIQEVEDLTRQLEKISLMLESPAQGYAPLYPRDKVDEDVLDLLYGYDKGLLGMGKEIEDAIIAMTEVRGTPWEGKIAHVLEILSNMEKRIEERDALCLLNGASV